MKKQDEDNFQDPAMDEHDLDLAGKGPDGHRPLSVIMNTGGKRSVSADKPEDAMPASPTTRGRPKQASQSGGGRSKASEKKKYAEMFA